jgi:hypothetical protein
MVPNLNTRLTGRRETLQSVEPAESAFACAARSGNTRPFEVAPSDAAGLPDDVRCRIASGEPAVRVIREWRCLSQVDLADRTGLAITQIMNAERGSVVSKPALRLIARGLHIVDTLLLDGR